MSYTAKRFFWQVFSSFYPKIHKWYLLNYNAIVPHRAPWYYGIGANSSLGWLYHSATRSIYHITFPTSIRPAQSPDYNLGITERLINVYLTMKVLPHALITRYALWIISFVVTTLYTSVNERKKENWDYESYRCKTCLFCPCFWVMRYSLVLSEHV